MLKNYKDKDKINNLKEHVLSYFYKTDEQSITPIKTKNRAIIRGTLPKSKSKAGRPRSNKVENKIEL